MSEAVKTVQKSSRGEVSTSTTNFKGTTKQNRKQIPGNVTTTRKPAKNTSEKGGYESVSKSEASVSSSTAAEDIGITITFKLRIKNFLGTGGGC